jgi:hypothetical protein
MVRIRNVRRQVVGAALALAAVVGVAGCDVPDEQHQVRLRLDEAPPPSGFYDTFANTGSGDVTVAVASRNAGTLVEAPGQQSARSVRFPAHDPATTSPRAVIRVTGNGPGDPLDPGTGTFSFGADVRMDAVTSAPGTQDDGDNVIQRGLFTGVSQYKLQVDGFRPMCRILGADGDVTAVSSVTLSPDVWYRLLCTREGTAVTVSVTSWDAAGEATTVTSTATGPTGDMAPAASTVPMAIGGKLNDNGTVTGATDQFNGSIDNPRLRFHP